NYPNGQIDLVTPGPLNRRNIFPSIAYNWDDNETDKCLADPKCLDESIDAVDEIVRADCHSDCRDNENNAASQNGELAAFGVFLLIAVAEQPGVAPSLEVDIEDI